MRVRIYKTFTFAAAHWLPNLPEGHKCSRLHGHTYRVKVWAVGEPDPRTGMLIDFADITTPIMEALDHRLLNDVPGLSIPSAENIAGWIYKRLAWRDPKLATVDFDLERVRVYESVNSYAEVPVPKEPSR